MKLTKIFVHPCAGLARVALGLMLLAYAGAAPAWDERNGGDLPWLGGGGRAHLYAQDSQCFGCTTGYQHKERWGRSAWTGEEPYITVSKAMQFLAGTGMVKAAPEAKGAGHAYVGGSEIVTPRALPYRFTVVMIEPTVIVMNFDLLALINASERPEGAQLVGTPYIDGYVYYGTRIPATGTLFWFSPDTRQEPTPVFNQSSGRSEISASGIRLALERRGDQWIVTR